MSVLGERLRQARMAKGWSLAKFSEAAGAIVSRQALHKYEKGLDVPRSDILMALVRALDVNLDFLLRPKASIVSLSEPNCRKRTRLGQRQVKSILAYTQNRIELWLELESYFSPDRFSRQVLSSKNARLITDLEHVEFLAKEIRKKLRLDLAPIENMTELLEDNGVKVISWPGEERYFDAFSCWAKEDIPIIVIKGGLPGDRQRSNLAHELGHLVMKPGKGLDEEAAARRFSGAFLVPDEIARRELGAKRHVLELAELRALKAKYGMSIQQWIYRAKDLGIISKFYADSQFRLFRQEGWHMREPGEILKEESSTRMRRLAVQAIAEDFVSPARAAELTNIPLSELRKEAHC